MYQPSTLTHDVFLELCHVKVDEGYSLFWVISNVQKKFFLTATQSVALQ